MAAKVLQFSARADKQLAKLPIHIQRKIGQRVDLFQQNPLLGVKLQGDLAPLYKLRVGNYRVIYDFNQITRTVTVIKIERRQGVYQ